MSLRCCMLRTTLPFLLQKVKIVMINIFASMPDLLYARVVLYSINQQGRRYNKERRILIIISANQTNLI